MILRGYRRHGGKQFEPDDRQLVFACSVPPDCPEGSGRWCAARYNGGESVFEERDGGEWVIVPYVRMWCQQPPCPRRRGPNLDYMLATGEAWL